MNLKGIQLTWLGHATFRMVTPAGRTVIIDPWIMNNPMCREERRTFFTFLSEAGKLAPGVEVVTMKPSVTVGV
jgi:L-ascorbate metabolism protein UlaG (beta-lactamase superfamily)